MTRVAGRYLRSAIPLALVALLGGCGLFGNKAPVASFTHELDRDTAPAKLTLDASDSRDADGEITAYAWDVAGTDHAGVSVTVDLPTGGDYLVTLRVTDDEGDTHSTSRTFTIRDAQPDVVPPPITNLALSARLDQFTVSSFTLGNVGSVPLDVSVTAESWLAVEPATVTLPGSSLQDFVVTATCASEVGTRSGNVTIASNDPDEPLITVPVTLTCTEPPASEFDIQFLFAPGSISASQQAVFQQAASRWAEVITGDLPTANLTQSDVNRCLSGFTFSGPVDDLLILVRGVVKDGPGQILGSAGPCLLRGGLTGLPALGRMDLDIDDIDALEANGKLLGVVMHEIGHVLNLTSFGWSAHGFLEFNAGTCLGSSSVRYTGANAVARWLALGGSGGVPVEDNGISGTACSHWDEDTFGIELMTGYIANEMALSTVTIGALDDLGYQVDYTAADPYTLPPDEPVRGAAAPWRIVEEVLPPVGILLPDGSVQPFGD